MDLRPYVRSLRCFTRAAAGVVVIATGCMAAGPALADATTRESPASLPPIASAPLARPAPAIPVGTYSTDQPTKVRALPEDDTATSDAWLMSNGGIQAQFHPGPVNYKPAGSATYVPIVTTLVKAPTGGGRWQSKANAWTASLGPSGGSTNLERVTQGSTTFGFSALNAQAESPQVTGSTATYEGLWPDVNATYSVTDTGVTEALSLTSPETQASFEFALTGGVTAQSASTGGLDLLAAGQTVATVPALTVSTAGGTVVPVQTAGASQAPVTDPSGRSNGAIEISVDPTWLSSLPASDFPVTIDPTVNPIRSPTLGYSGSLTQGTHTTHQFVEAGFTTTIRTAWRGFFRFNFSTYQRKEPPWVVEGAYLQLQPQSGSAGGTTPLSVYFDEGLSDGIEHWETITTHCTTTGCRHQQLVWSGTTTGSTITIPVTTAVRTIFGSACTTCFRFGLVGDTTRGTPSQKIYGTRTIVGTSKPDFDNIELSVDLVQAPTPPSHVTSPATGSTIPTATPTITGSPVFTVDTPGSMSYEFLISTDANGDGQVINSGWIDRFHTAVPTWTVPKGSLVNGETYYIRMATALITTTSRHSRPSNFSRTSVEFKVTLHLGSGGPSPTDTIGAAPGATTTPAAGSPSPGTSPASETVNLVTGDLAFTSTTHSLTSLAGPVGLTLSYNSLESTAHGLLGQYYLGSSFASTKLVGQRTDAGIDTDWGTGKPIGGITPSSGPYGVDWTGSITVPTTQSQTWQFGVTTDDAMKVTVGGTVVITHSGAGLTYGSTQTLSSGAHPITVKAWGKSYTGTFQLWARRKITKPVTTWPQYLVPSTWLSPTDLSLPAGWSLSASNLQGGWTGLSDEGSTVVLQSSTGATAAFTSTETGHYQAPAGYTDLYLTTDGQGQLQLSTPTGLLYTFNTNGSVHSIVTVPDSLHPDSLTYAYTPTTLALTTITDPVSDRSVHLYYGGTATHCPSTTTHAPKGMLCEIHYWDTTKTLFDYNATAELISVVNPGSSVADFGYTSQGRVDAIRDPLANDAIATGAESDCPASGTTKDCETQVTYNAPGQETGKVTSVTQPVPTPGASRPKRTYTYTATTRTAEVSIAGFNPASGFDEKVVYDAKQRITSETSSAGLVSKTFWNNLTEQVSSVAPNGEETTSVYNRNGAVTDSYGPAPTACFTAAATYKPVPTPLTKSGCGVAVPDTQTTYDQGITGLAATYWTNGTFAGDPSLHATVADIADQTWSTPPVSPSTGKEWTARLTGLIDLSRTTRWTFQSQTTQTVAVYINGELATHSTHGTQPGTWGKVGLGSGAIEVTPPGEALIEIDFKGRTTSANSLKVTASSTTFRTQTVTATMLDPNYGLKTSVTTPDGDVTDYSYTGPTDIGPQYGLVTATTEDPGTGQLNLTTKTTYQPPSKTTYLQKTSTVLPAGNATTYSYYTGTGGPIANTCGVSSTTPQGGQLEKQSDPAPSTATANKRRVEEFVYDAAGQQVGVRVGDRADITSASWQCTHYGTDGRIKEQSYPAYDGAPARTVTYTYSVGHNPLETSVTATTKTVTSTVDLLGRVTSYIDASGKTTTTTYDQAAQVTAATGPGGDETETYNPTSGQLTTVKLTGTTEATASYCTVAQSTPTDPCAGQLASVSYGNGTTSSYRYDAYGTEVDVAYAKGTTTFAGDDITKSVGGRELTDSPFTPTSGTFANPSGGGTDFTYDKAGRLTQAVIVGATVTYSYADNATSDGCADPDEGENTNRTKVTYHPVTQGTATTDSCYNSADQLTKTITSGTAPTAGSGTSTTYAYDTQGYETKNKTTTYTWTASGQLASAASATTTLTSTYDPVNRLLSQRKGTTATAYAYCGYTTTPCAVLNGSGTVTQKVLSLPGGVTLTAQSSGNLWTYPNLQGDEIATTNQSGVVQGAVVTYTPFGRVYPKATAPTNLNGSATLGAFGAHGKLQEDTLPTPVVLMSARAYLPTEGRFLSVDPVDGGCANAYVYVKGDPLDQSDLDGQNYCGSITATTALDIADGGVVASAVLDALGEVVGAILSALTSFEAASLRNAANTALTWATQQRKSGHYRTGRGTNGPIAMVAITVPTFTFLGLTIPDGLPTFKPWVKNSYTSKGVNPCTQ